jgi:hypothetical protein
MQRPWGFAAARPTHHALSAARRSEATFLAAESALCFICGGRRQCTLLMQGVMARDPGRLKIFCDRSSDDIVASVRRRRQCRGGRRSVAWNASAARLLHPAPGRPVGRGPVGCGPTAACIAGDTVASVVVTCCMNNPSIGAVLEVPQRGGLFSKSVFPCNPDGITEFEAEMWNHLCRPR